LSRGFDKLKKYGIIILYQMKGAYRMTRLEQVKKILKENPDITRSEISRAIGMNYQNLCTLIRTSDLKVKTSPFLGRKKKDFDLDEIYEKSKKLDPESYLTASSEEQDRMLREVGIGGD
jgi:hypothetical protein